MPPTDLTAAVPAPDLTAYQTETAGIVLDNLAPSTRRAYRIALAAVDDWHAGREPTDATGSSPLARGTLSAIVLRYGHVRFRPRHLRRRRARRTRHTAMGCHRPARPRDHGVLGAPSAAPRHRLLLVILYFTA